MVICEVFTDGLRKKHGHAINAKPGPLRSRVMYKENVILLNY